ncbi:hypothetical protein HBHAL_4691 [Halobacillus halophilus DSM 2266]|uniref:Uncharacterized protein n=1 Tax=Halobacillus halophilus (strain ATCC 35676 / DSM 2266 / JCM 20832 / KCTC 3685 / LMG 17431 / NBRC 102448 / NCIMB 2269) TaxID=866895 RepID=I0JSA7_HALH3|nr:hypothetical protein HBHAL_4691 [Halobacillus halophilus DSM 2266]
MKTFLIKHHLKLSSKHMTDQQMILPINLILILTVFPVIVRNKYCKIMEDF